MTITALICVALLSAAPRADEDFAARCTPVEGTRPAQWRVVWTREPQSRATISWTTREAGTSHRVLYAISKDGPLASSAPSQRDGAYTRRDDEDGEPAFFHHARLEGLPPSTTIRFVLESDGERSHELSFITAPVDERPFSLLVGGDSRSGWEARCQVNEAMAARSAADASILALSHGGDYVMYGGSWRDWSAWLSHHELTTNATGRVLPIVPTRGNHDFGPLFGEVFDDPGEDTPAYYTTELSPLATLITLNSEAPVAGDQLSWLEQALPRARAATRWVLVSYHRALYPAVKGPGEALSFWPPLFDRHGVDLVFESDGHAIKRTLPIRDSKPHANGVVYIGEGGLGVPQRTPRKEPWYLQPPGMVTNGHHVIRVDFAPDGMRSRFLRLGDARDRWDPDQLTLVVAPGATWSYHVGDEPPASWTQPGFDASAWPSGEAGFGFEDDDDVTILESMRGAYQHMYVRRTFDAELVADTEELTLLCRFDDAFVAYLNGVEVARDGFDPPRKPGGEPRVRPREANQLLAFELANWRELVQPGENVLALIGSNRSKRDRDFTLDPWLAGDRTSQPGSEEPFAVIDDVSFELRAR